ncbi:MAG: hypothetical protein WD595_04350 [Waddliaceae bacterium]
MNRTVRVILSLFLVGGAFFALLFLQPTLIGQSSLQDVSIPSAVVTQNEIVGRAIALSTEQLFDVVARAEGTVQEIFVEKDQMLDAKEKVATVYHPKRRATLLQLKTDFLQLQQLFSELKVLEDRVISRERLYEKGLIPKTVLEDSQLAVSQKRIAVSKVDSSLANHLAELSNFSMLEDEEFLIKLDEIENSEGEFDLVVMEEELSSVFTTESGKVLDVLVKPRESIKANDPIIRMEREEKEDTPLIFYCTIRVAAKKMVYPEMTAYITPTDVNPSTYGKIVGKISHVSPFAITQDEILEKLRKKEVVRFLTEGESSMIPIKIEPVLDPSTKSGFKWTDGNGPPQKIRNGTLCLVEIPLNDE